MQDNEMKAGIFPGKVIIVDNGKLYVIEHKLTGWRKNAFSTEFLPPCRQREDSTSKTETLGYFPREERSPNPFSNAVAKVAA
jgi:hypothetical protein